MGAAQSTDVIQVTEIVNQNLTTVMNRQINSSTTSCNSIQSLKVSNAATGLIDCGSGIFEITQTNLSVCSLEAFFSSTSTSDLKNTIKSSVEQAATSSNSAVNGFLATSFNYASSSQQMWQHINNIIETNVTNEIFNSCKVDITSTQHAELSNAGIIKGNGCLLSQNLQITATASCITKAVTDVINANSQFVEAASKAVASNTSKNTGLDGLLSALLGPYALIIIGIVIAIVVVIVVFLNIFKAPLSRKIDQMPVPGMGMGMGMGMPPSSMFGSQQRVVGGNENMKYKRLRR